MLVFPEGFDDRLAFFAPNRFHASVEVDPGVSATELPVPTMFDPRVDRVHEGVCRAQDRCSLRPTSGAGRPGIVMRIAQPSGHAKLCSTHTFGSRFVSRCGSLESIAAPDAVREPDMHQLFEAIIRGAATSHFTASGTIRSANSTSFRIERSNPSVQPGNSASRCASPMPA